VQFTVHRTMSWVFVNHFGAIRINYGNRCMEFGRDDFNRI